jgi:hypothetical protein
MARIQKRQLEQHAFCRHGVVVAANNVQNIQPQSMYLHQLLQNKLS